MTSRYKIDGHWVFDRQERQWIAPDAGTLRVVLLLLAEQRQQIVVRRTRYEEALPDD